LEGLNSVLEHQRLGIACSMRFVPQGIVLLTGSSTMLHGQADTESANPLQYGVLFAALAIISVGTGGIKPNVRCAAVVTY
jgi:dipeptide/tripeptide permease